MKVNIKKSGNGPLSNLKYTKVVKFGIPKTTTVRPKEDDDDDKDPLTNADILAIMEAGSIRMNIPARKLLEPVVNKHEDKIREMFKLIFDALLSGNVSQADMLMERLALRVETWTKSYFTEDNNWTPNAPITVHGGWMINKVSGKPVYIKGKGSDQPLIDTGELRKAIKGLVVDRDS